jgi:hypothetical protein
LVELARQADDFTVHIEHLAVGDYCNRPRSASDEYTQRTTRSDVWTEPGTEVVSAAVQIVQMMFDGMGKR